MDKQQEENIASSSPSSPGRSGGGERREDAAAAAVPAGPPCPTFVGKHRMAAAISHLHTQINIIQEELNELETVSESSIVCKEFVASIESISDPLLPWSKGAPEVGWDRWFRGAHNTRSNNRWI
ncbi:guanine nucleotide-binding protein subunit gamma 2-like [Argentina anserina]|uniref:guanine nucleotide-binding protein subunit gamma 2-like n=1 Tax=Argentina anserina TaxID=57926 RepID=UPI0021769275|nr:guanine nucleotide-binding protein subunit gamma 2-like [Potentilla anserina]